VQKLKNAAKANIVAGLAVLIPVGLTVYVVNMLIDTTDNLFLLFPETVNIEPLRRIPGVSIAFALILVFCTGAIARNYFGKMLVRMLNRLAERIPVIASIYKTLRQITESFIGGEGKKGFQKVVYVEWPRRGTWTLAFVTADAGPKFYQRTGFDPGEKYYNLFIPATPNPTSGFYFLVKQDQCIDAAMSTEEAFKIIISTGALSD
jgi:uncharacterized membrane protein